MSTTDKPTTSRISSKLYRCRECGHEMRQTTNHYGETYSWGSYNACPKCPPLKRPTVWDCAEACPDDMGKPEPWKVVTLGEVATITEVQS